MKPLVLFGTGELADLAFYYFGKKGGRVISAFTVDAAHLKENTLHGLPVAPFEDVTKAFPAATHDMFIAIGSNKLNAIRAQKYAEAKLRGYALATFISPDSAVHTDKIGDNCFIMDYNNIHPYCTVGNNVIFSNDNHIGHHSVIGDHCFISSNVVMGGGAHIGEYSFLGINATIRDHVKVGKRNIIGAAALILKDTQDDEVYSVEHTHPRETKSDRITKI